LIAIGVIGLNFGVSSGCTVIVLMIVIPDYVHMIFRMMQILQPIVAIFSSSQLPMAVPFE